MRLVPGFQLRSVGGEWIAVPSAAAAVRFNGLISLNETAAFLFRALGEPTDRASLLAALCERFDAPQALLERDLDAFLDQMRELTLLDDDEA